MCGRRTFSPRRVTPTSPMVPFPVRKEVRCSCTKWTDCRPAEQLDESHQPSARLQDLPPRARGTDTRAAGLRLVAQPEELDVILEAT